MTFKDKKKSLVTDEIFNPLTHHSCPVGNLKKDIRVRHTLCNNMVCGGVGKDGDFRSCKMFDGNTTFKSLPVRLLEKRSRHICWGLKSGDVLLLGGEDSKWTTERISADGSTSSLDFTLPYGIM